MSQSKSERVYRPVEPSDLPKIQAGTLKAFWSGIKSRPLPVKLITTNLENATDDKCLWLIQDPIYGDRTATTYLIVVDVTPEKRYAIWNHKLQRFYGEIFQNKYEAEMFLGLKNFTSAELKNYYVVEWEIKDVV